MAQKSNLKQKKLNDEPTNETVRVDNEAVRVDSWLWAARFFKTRQLAIDAVNLNRVAVNGEVVKPSRRLKIGDLLTLRRPPFETVLHVRGLTTVRSAAAIAQLLYEETLESQTARTHLAAELKAIGPPMLKGRPVKRDRRDLEKLWQASELNKTED